ncbi:MAG: 50S ribosomal protein L30 [Candidatus Aenigmarchaeota archaeon]|nr:50S ribosomal protein L30 [Candidatus Aenigmarchaeota archaeon]MDW8160024.1 50S ribosomal protein L30 [Candidatus Aenigmarchaeota archaeon]
MYVAVRIRGTVGVPKKIEDTLNLLRLKKKFNCNIFLENESIKGMLEKVKDFITYGEIDKETLVLLLKKRLRMRGKENRKVTEEDLKKITGLNNFEEFAEKLMKGELKIKDFEEFQPNFRLRPPSKGLKSIKEHWPKGDLGYRGKEINELIKRMI